MRWLICVLFHRWRWRVTAVFNHSGDLCYHKYYCRECHREWTG